MSSNLYKRPSDFPHGGRPPSVTTGIPISRTSKTDALRNAGQHRGSVTAPSASKPALSLPRESRDTIPQDTQPKVCECCEEHKSPIWNCSYCGMDFCDACWVMQAQHKPGRTGPDGLPHEKANPSIVKRLKEILTPSQDHVEQQSLHIEDEDTTWFGLARDQQNRPIFQDYGRYSTIMADSNTGEFKSRYPQLVSFIGQTGAGKSTLIKMLIDQQERTDRTREWNFPSPVAGALSNGSVPTSGDVHLYSDPSTYSGEYPMIYADCEGLEGGENTPMAAQYRNTAIATPREKGRDHHTSRDHRKRRKASNTLYCTQRDITWANSPDTLKRQYAVTELYPRLLYTFSDVIVFVLRNPKTFESTVLSMLINWASTSLEKSVNQPTLPHAVIALNATDTKVNQQEWDPEHATNWLMSTVAGAVDRDPNFRQLAAEWNGRGKRIRTMKDLLECFYSSITVVRIPGEGRYMMIDDQITKLRDVISKRCADSFNAKRRSRMLSNSETLNVYLQCAYDHFAHDLHKPFNFMDISFQISPIPLDFGGNVLKLAVALKARYENPKKIFKELSFMVSSCILLDCVRQGLRGTPEQILEKQYLDYCDSALEDFCAIFWPCTFRSRRGEQCVNVRERHTKGHQNQRGHIISSGPYESNFTFDEFADDWFHYLKTFISQFQAELNSKMVTSLAADELAITTELHHDNINRFYHHVGGAGRFISHSSCFCCLRELAEHPLACGHVLCTACIKGYGKPSAELLGSYTMASCPLHDFDTVFRAPSEIYFKPPLAGVRVLSLDGGGMRGIVILEVLRQIELELGDCIPIQDFFDLVVGTSTGGIIALGLGIKNWRVEDCMKLFLRLVEKAFTTKFLGGVSFGTTKYRTQPLEEALGECFKEEAMFGGIPDTPRSARKVAVTAATETGEQAVIFTNYNRADDEQIGYRLMRPDDPKDDLKIREAARATSAAPTFFKPFRNSRTKEGFLDGAIFHNNPVRIANYESKLLWPDAEECHPDILLSIGTAQHGGEEADSHLDSARFDRRRMQMRQKISQAKPTMKTKRSIAGLRGLTEIESWVSIFKKRVESVLDPENTWREFSKEISTSAPVAAERYIRINPRTFNRTPKMDDKTQVHVLHDEIRARLKSNTETRLKIRDVAHRLVASSFYFEKSGPPRVAGDRIVLQGNIRCRFAAGSENLRNLGEYIRRHQRPSFQPCFRVQEVKHDKSAQTIYITANIIREMYERGLFQMESIVIPTSAESALLSMNLYLMDERVTRGGYAISGFPRSIADGEALKRTPTPNSPNPERPKMSVKRQSLRHKRHRFALERPASDSNINYTSLREAALSQNSNGLGIYPETPDDVSDWERRRSEASRQPPKPMQTFPQELESAQPAPNGYLYELDAGPIMPASQGDENLARHSDPRPQNDDIVVPRIMRTDSDADLERGLELSQRDIAKFSTPTRAESGFDEEEMAEALARSLQMQ